MNNNYANVEEEEYRHSNVKLWNPKGFIVIGILFSFLPAAILYSINYGRLGFRKEVIWHIDKLYDDYKEYFLEIAMSCLK